MKYLFLFAIIGLCVTNPTLDDGIDEAKRRISEDQGAIRASWSAVSEISGIDWVKKQAGLGTYEFCRKSFYAFSVFSIQNSKMLENDQPIALAFGVANNIYGGRIDSNENSAIMSYILKTAGENAKKIEFTECKEFNKQGDLTAS